MLVRRRREQKLIKLVRRLREERELGPLPRELGPLPFHRAVGHHEFHTRQFPLASPTAIAINTQPQPELPAANTANTTITTNNGSAAALNSLSANENCLPDGERSVNTSAISDEEQLELTNIVEFVAQFPEGTVRATSAHAGAYKTTGSSRPDETPLAIAEAETALDTSASEWCSISLVHTNGVEDLSRKADVRVTDVRESAGKETVEVGVMESASSSTPPSTSSHQRSGNSVSDSPVHIQKGFSIEQPCPARLAVATDADPRADAEENSIDLERGDAKPAEEMFSMSYRVSAPSGLQSECVHQNEYTDRTAEQQELPDFSEHPVLLRPAYEDLRSSPEPVLPSEELNQSTTIEQPSLEDAVSVASSFTGVPSNDINESGQIDREIIV